MVQWAFASIFVGYVIAFLLFIPLVALRIQPPFILVYVVGFVLSFYGLYRWRGAKLSAKINRVLGRRGKSTVVLSSNQLKGSKSYLDGTADGFDVSLRDIRRLRLINTLRGAIDIKKSDIAILGAMTAQPTVGRAALVGGANQIGQARQQKAAVTCFAVMLDYANTSAAIADGLDELTAMNLFDDVDRDLKARTQAISR